MLWLALPLMLLQLAQHAVKLDPGADTTAWLPPLLTLPLVVVAWCAMWALMSKLFQHRFDFMGHLRIVLPWVLGIELLDAIVTPLAHAGHYSERIAQMPASYQPNDRQRALPDAPSRAACGLPDDALVFSCFNQAYKITPQVLDAWARILHGAPASVLWLLAWNEQAERNLMMELSHRGIDLSRVIFAVKKPLNDHIARLRCADLFLDTWPCNAHTTASEALWAGVPVLTLPGSTFASRVAASLARASLTDELICDSADTYVATALALAHDLPRLRRLQAHLATQRLNLPLFDSLGYTKDLEALLLRMHERAIGGLDPAALPAVLSASGPSEQADTVPAGL